MHYERPTFVEIKMDAEVRAYQDGFEFDRDNDPVRLRSPVRSAPLEAAGAAKDLSKSG